MGRKLTVEEVKARVEEVHGDKIEVDWSGYVNVTTNVKCRCNVCGHEWSTNVHNLIRGTSCPECVTRSKRMSLEEVISRVNEVHGDKLAVDYSGYVNSRSELKCTCNLCGFVWYASTYSLSKGHGCKHCCKKLSIDTVKKKIFEKFGNQFEIDWSSYKNTNIKVKCKCNVCGSVYYKKPTYLLGGSGCDVCRPLKKVVKIEDVIAKIEEVHEGRISMEESSYVNASSKATMICNVCGNKWKQAPTIVISGYGCKKCAAEKRKISLEKVKERIHKNFHGLIEVCTNDYKDLSSNVGAKCKVCGHTWNPQASSLCDKHGCPKCGVPQRFKYEEPFEHFLKEIGVSFKHNKPIDGCINPETNSPLFFDFLIPKDSPKLLIEIDGVQHFRQVFCGDFEGGQMRDTIKNKYAKDNGLILIRASDSKERTPKHLKIKELEDVLRDNCNEGVLCMDALLKYDFNR